MIKYLSFIYKYLSDYHLKRFQAENIHLMVRLKLCLEMKSYFQKSKSSSLISIELALNIGFFPAFFCIS